MRIHKTTFYILQITFFLVAPLLVAGFIFATLYMGDVYDVHGKVHAEQERLKNAAKIYHSRIRTYEGLCKDIGVRHPFRCNESESEFAIEVPSENGKFICFDSQNFSGELSGSISEATRCR